LGSFSDDTQQEISLHQIDPSKTLEQSDSSEEDSALSFSELLEKEKMKLNKG